jgi:hypothetical protein
MLIQDKSGMLQKAAHDSTRYRSVDAQIFPGYEDLRHQSSPPVTIALLSKQ